MLLNLLNTLLLSVGMGAHLSIAPVLTNNEKPKLQENRAANITTPYEAAALQLSTNNVTRDVEAWNANAYTRISTDRVNYQLNTNYINVFINEYRQSHNWYDTGHTSGNIYNQGTVNQTNTREPTLTDLTWKLNSQLIIMQVTGYNLNVQTTIKVKFSYSFNLAQADNWEHNLYYSCIQSQDPTWANYINNSFWETTNDLYNWYENNIINPSLGYTYSEYVGYNERNEDYLETEITVLPQTTNYVVITAIPFVYNPQNPINEQTKVVYFRYNSPSNTMVIKGINVIPTGDYEIVNLPGLLFDILTMPFTFISMAFNLTLFPGTPYQVNISNLFLTLIGIAIFIFIINIFIKAGKSAANG